MNIGSVQAQSDIALKIETLRQSIDLQYQFGAERMLTARQRLRRCVNKLISGVNWT
jgi:hypothetical protein